MSKSRIFYTDEYKEIEKAIAKLLNAQPDFLSTRTAASTRAAGDAIQAILSEHFRSILGDLCAEYSAEFARRAMADLAFTDRDGFYYEVVTKFRGRHYEIEIEEDVFKALRAKARQKGFTISQLANSILRRQLSMTMEIECICQTYANLMSDSSLNLDAFRALRNECAALREGESTKRLV